ncbi:MAG: tetratricopeptide repeat protein [Rhodospirillaceae bacterium]|nr:tetratricopeptide repeat protein [Rhodospirillaceae bacterium]
MSDTDHGEPSTASATIESVRVLIEKGRPYDAEVVLKEELKKAPGSPQMLCHLGIALHDQGRIAEAIDALQQATTLDPTDAPTQFALGTCYTKLSDHQSAIKHFEKCLESNPSLFQVNGALAEAFERTYQYAAAADLARTALEHNPKDVFASITLARCLRHMGQAEAALTVLDGIDWIDASLKASANTSAIRQKSDLERARCLLDLEDFSPAFRSFEKSNASYREAHPKWLGLKTLFQQDIWAQRTYVDALSKRSRKAGETETPLFAKPQAFVAGFPRSGTTLLRTILASHPDLAVVQESPAFGDACVFMPGGLATPATPEHILHNARTQYYAAVKALIPNLPYRVLVDIYPFNTRLVAWMKELFPQAKLILMARHPCDVCLSAYMQTFEINTLTAGMLTLEDTVQTYIELMSLWNDAVKALSLDVLTVRYEDIVSDFQPEVTRVLNHIGVEWDANVSRFNQTARLDQPKTASDHQVIKPLYDHASYRWKQCRSMIEPHFDSLAPFVEAYGYDLD